MHGSTSPNALEQLASSTFDDRRREPRVRCRKQIRILPGKRMLERAWIAAELQECAAHGVSLMLDRPLEVGEQFMIRLTLDQPRLLIYIVRHCQPTGSQYHVGAEFTEMIAASSPVPPNTVLQALLAMEG